MNTDAEALPAGCRGTPFRIALGLVALAGFATALIVPGDPAPVRAANEAAAQKTLGEIGVAQERYRAEHGRYGSLGELAEAGLIERVIAERGGAGYAFQLAHLGSTSFTARAEPAVPGKSGERWFEQTDGGALTQGPAK